MKKRTVAACICALGIVRAFGLDFSGYAGILGDYTGLTDPGASYSNELKMEGFLAAQFDMNGKFIFRGEFHLKTENLLPDSDGSNKKNLLNPAEANTLFRIGELSLTYKISSSSVTHFLSAFFGKFEPVGSDVFLQRHLGLLPVSSRLTENWGGLVGTSIFNPSGFGLSYTAHFHKSLVFGAYLHAYNAERIAISPDSVNTELRIAGSFPGIIFDVSSNVAFEFTTDKKLTNSESGDEYKYVVVVDSVVFKLGANLLLGDRYGTSVLVQAGVSGLKIPRQADDQFGWDDVYLFVEPRLNFGETQVQIAVFQLPNQNLQDMLYLPGYSAGGNGGSVGANLCIANSSIRTGSVALTVGGHLTVCTNKNIGGVIDTFSALKSPADVFQVLGVYLTPFVSMPVFGGEFKAALSLNPLAFIPTSITGTEASRTALDAFVGFKVRM